MAYNMFRRDSDESLASTMDYLLKKITELELALQWGTNNEEKRAKRQAELNECKDALARVLAEIERRREPHAPNAKRNKAATKTREEVSVVNDKLARAAQEVIGNMEVDALILARDTSLEAIRCERLDGTTYLTIRRKVRI